MTWNNYGCDAAAVLRRYALAGYVPAAADFGGADAVADAMGDAAEEITQAMPASVLNLLQFPDLCILVQRATEGQTEADFPTIGKPVLAGSVHVWAGPPQAFTSKPVLITTPWAGNWPAAAGVPFNVPTPPGALTELPEASFSADLDGVTLAQPRNRNDMVLASWQVDVESVGFIIPSLASAVATGAAAALGAKVYPQATSQWDLVQRYADSFAATVAALAKGEAIPPEVRALQWWKEPEPSQAGGIGSARRFRA